LIPSTSLNLNIPFSVLGGWLSYSPRPLTRSRWVGTVVKDICGMTGPLIKGEVLMDGQKQVLPRWPNLQRQTCKDRHFQCTLCNAAYTEQKALNRHNTKAHMGHESNLSRPGEVLDKTNRRIPLRGCEERGSLGLNHGKSLTHEKVPSYSPLEAQPTTDHNEGCKGKGGERVTVPLNCTECNLTYKTSGGLARHLKNKHGTEVPKAKARGLVKDCIEQPVPPVTETVPNMTDLPPQNENSFSRRCLLCSAPGAGKSWTAFKSAQNHMAGVHGINARTGLPSRKRKTKATQ
jgi:uncharacterized C2H2 Zn-finger protein